MNDDTIRSKVEAIDSVVRQYAQDIDVFRKEVDGKMRDLDSAMGRLGNVWTGTLHDNFADRMHERQSHTLRSLGATEEQIARECRENRRRLAGETPPPPAA